MTQGTLNSIQSKGAVSKQYLIKGSCPRTVFDQRQLPPNSVAPGATASKQDLISGRCLYKSAAVSVDTGSASANYRCHI